MNRIFWVFVSLCCLMGACGRQSGESSQSKDGLNALPLPSATAKVTLNHARRFQVSYIEQAKLVEVPMPYKGADEPIRYLLVPRGTTPPKIDVAAKIIETPVRKVVCTSTTHLPALEMLSLEDKLVGFPSTKFISSQKINARVDNGQVAELGSDKGLNVEALALAAPDLVIGYTLNGDYKQFALIEKMGIPTVMTAAYLEETPLGKAEWLKFMALFFDIEQNANALYEDIETQYVNLQAKTKGLSGGRPTVFTGTVYKDIWYMPGGKSWSAKLLHDAGARFLWAASDEPGSMALSFEAVFDKAQNADFWLGPNYNSLTLLESADQRYASFKAFQKGQVYSPNKRINANGGNDYFETGSTRPDLVLKDLVKILHPSLLPDYELYFYQQLVAEGQ